MRILQVALELFSSNGYGGTRTREIAQRAEITEVTLFRHFRSKEALFEATILHYLPCPDFKVLIATATELEYREALELIARSFFDGLMANTGLISMMYKEGRRHFDLLDKVYVALIKNLATLLTAYFADLQTKKIVRKLDPSVMATMFLGTLLSLYEYDELLFYTRTISSDGVSKIDGVVDVFVYGTICL